ncbi:MAG: hypothetical protein JNK57_13065 [Planctomycetaceae bacterium]|jgi:hypothetical protein|nr:hypothetical protein [Planctomycetaceae bacterium]
METTLHRQLKTLYAAPGDRLEQELGKYRIDVAKSDCLVEVQHSSLNAIRGKVSELLRRHRVVVVKPLVVKTRIVRLNRKGGQVVSRRWSPKRGQMIDLFDELIYFRELFPHPNLTLEIPLVQIEEWRFQGHGRRVRTRLSDHQVQDQLLLGVEQTVKLNRPTDLWNIVARPTQCEFSTQDLSKLWQVPRYQAQKIAYTLQHCEAIDRIGKSGNSWVYGVARSKTTTAKPLSLRVAG